MIQVYTLMSGNIGLIIWILDWHDFLEKAVVTATGDPTISYLLNLVERIK